MKNYKKLYNALCLASEAQQKDLDYKIEQNLKLLDENRKLREENWNKTCEIKYYNGISELLEKYHHYMIQDINLLLDKDVIENYIKLLKAAKGEK